MYNIDEEYRQLLMDILIHGIKKEDRTGTGTQSVFGRQIRHSMSEGFPLLTTKKMAWKSIVTELLWFLRGDTNIKFLLDYDCHIWTGDAYKGYEAQCVTHSVDPMSKEQFISAIKLGNNNQPHFIPDLTGYKLGDLGPIYGKQWRSWKRYRKVEDTEHKETLHIIDYVDQIQNLINGLKTDPDSRRLMVSAWNVGELDQMVLPPCHYGFQVYTRELSLDERVKLFSKNVNGEHLMKYANSDGLDVWNEILNKHTIPTRAISLMWNQRSVDTFLGLPFNIASYGLLLMMIADEVNMIPDELVGNLGDVHLYSDHIEQAKEQISRKPFDLPTVHVRDGIESFMPGDIILENYQSHPAIKAPLSN
jgi:thymidylate synthase